MLDMPSFKINFSGHRFGGGGSGNLRCPYKGCEQTFDKPSMLTDRSVIPSESYYACPHCMSKIELVTDKLKIVDIRAVGYAAEVFESPAKCAHYSSGSLNSPAVRTNPESGNGNSQKCNQGVLTDECLICPKILQCEQRRNKY